jgi:hypothetical protein
MLSKLLIDLDNVGQCLMARNMHVSYRLDHIHIGANSHAYIQACRQPHPADADHDCR